MNSINYAGAVHDPVAALIFCAPKRVDFTVVGGKLIVAEGRMETVDESDLIYKHNALSHQLLEG